MSQRQKSVSPELREFADQVGEFIQYWGFKKVHGRIWTHLYLSRPPLDAGEIMRRLNISKALVSMSLGELLDYDVIEEAGKSPRGTLVYTANVDVMGVILNVLRLRERKMLSRISMAHKLLASSPLTEQKAHGVDAEAMERMGFLVALGCQGLESFLDKFRFDLSPAKKMQRKSPRLKS